MKAQALNHASVSTRLLMVVFIFASAATLAFADLPAGAPVVPPSTGSEEVSPCSSEINKAEEFIGSHGADLISAEVAHKAAKICETEFTKKELIYFDSLIKICDASFAETEGTASQALLSICHMNAARFILGLNLSINEKRKN